MEKIVLPCGLRVIVDPMPHLETVACGLWVKTGSRDEAEDYSGVSHALEHMVFKGTARRTAQQIAEDIENVGGHLNAYTSREVTAYHARVLKQDTPLAIEMIADLMQTPTFPDEEWQREYQVIHQEIGQSEDTPDDIIFDHAQKTAYPDHPLGWPVLGTYDSVERLNPDVFRYTLKTRYRPENSVFVLSGAVQPETAYRWVEEHWGRYGSDLQETLSPRALARYQGGARHEERDLEQLHLILGFEGVSADTPRERFALGLLSSLLGGGMSSRLFQIVREKHGLVYSIYSFHHEFQDTGFFGIYAGTEAQQYGKIVPMIRDICQDVCHNVTADELKRAQNQFKSSLMMGWESPRYRCESLAYQMLMRGSVLLPQEMAETIDAITREEIHALAQRIMGSSETQVTLGHLTS